MLGGFFGLARDGECPIGTCRVPFGGYRGIRGI